MVCSLFASPSKILQQLRLIGSLFTTLPAYLHKKSTEGADARITTNSRPNAKACVSFLIDEISMVSAQLLGQLETFVNRVVRQNSGYKKRSDKTPRCFGGINVLLFGDWSQIKPVGGTALFSNPDDAPTETALHGLMLLWEDGPNAVHKCWELTTSMRCQDKWYNAFLTECRAGNLSKEMYNSIHGFPTQSPIFRWLYLQREGICRRSEDIRTCTISTLGSFIP